MASDLQHGAARFSGIYYDGSSSRATEVEVCLDVDGMIRVSGPGIERAEKIGECPLSEPLGRMPRHFAFADGARLEVADLDSLAAWEKMCGRSSGLHWVHFLESHWRWAGLSALFLLGFVLAGYFWGVPLAADQITRRLPPEVGRMATSQAREVFTRLFDFEDSKLPAERRAAITKKFDEMVKAMNGGDFNYRLEFFHAPMPNAFALPDGLVCITDELIEKAKDDREIFGVLAHEIVHVRERHGMRMVLQNSAIFLIWTLMTGDLASVASIGATLPTVLAQSGYSRGFETEADRGAAEYMIGAGWGTKPLRDMLKRIDPEHTGLGGAEEAISSHPLTEKRIALLEELERAAEKENQSHK